MFNHSGTTFRKLKPGNESSIELQKDPSWRIAQRNQKAMESEGEMSRIRYKEWQMVGRKVGISPRKIT